MWFAERGVTHDDGGFNGERKITVWTSEIR